MTKTLKQIYGSCLSINFVEKMQDLAKEAQIRIRCNTKEVVNQDTTNPNVEIGLRAIDFWSDIEGQCRAWLRSNV